LVKNFRERKIGNHWIKDFNGFVEKQWTDFSFRLSDGESLSQVQARNIQALETLLKEHPEQTLVVGSHGTALSAIIN
ncbi:histidine phosphatase family protein, partial [Salmonella sp. ZJQZ20_0020]|uniref:histidine phosphatase family protein n=1 Tax=Salmonella sp. ZJQZ20_0020 TaxID=3159627 RepID=UPI003981008F